MNRTFLQIKPKNYTHIHTTTTKPQHNNSNNKTLSLLFTAVVSKSLRIDMQIHGWTDFTDR